VIPILRLVHIVFGVFWVGAVLFATFVLMPSMKASGPSGIVIMKELGRRRMPMIMMGSAILTVGAGIWMMILFASGAPGWMSTTTGRTFSMGGALAILSLVIGMIVNAPAARRMGAIGEAVGRRGGPPTAEEAQELARLQARMGTAGVVVAILLLLATAAMAVARYLP
jgi:uncharacterized membrane protein